MLTRFLPIPSTERSSLQSPSGWVPLLLALLYEYTSPQSRWRPYLSLWTDFKTLDHPMFWQGPYFILDQLKAGPTSGPLLPPNVLLMTCGFPASFCSHLWFIRSGLRRRETDC